MLGKWHFVIIYDYVVDVLWLHKWNTQSEIKYMSLNGILWSSKSRRDARRSLNELKRETTRAVALQLK